MKNIQSAIQELATLTTLQNNLKFPKMQLLHNIEKQVQLLRDLQKIINDELAQIDKMQQNVEKLPNAEPAALTAFLRYRVSFAEYGVSDYMFQVQREIYQENKEIAES
jgi:hypothetical protein